MANGKDKNNGGDLGFEARWKVYPLAMPDQTTPCWRRNGRRLGCAVGS